MFQSQANSIKLLISLCLGVGRVLAMNTCLLCPGPGLRLSFMLPVRLPVCPPFLQQENNFFRHLSTWCWCTVDKQRGAACTLHNKAELLTEVAAVLLSLKYIFHNVNDGC